MRSIYTYECPKCEARIVIPLAFRHDGRAQIIVKNAKRIEHHCAPVVDVPTEPALGWLDTKWSRQIGVWQRVGVAVESMIEGRHEDDITAFTPAVAVPKAALDELREVHDRCEATYPDYRDAVVDFIMAVDAANGGDPR